MSLWLPVVIVTRLANFLVVEIDKLDVDASGFTTCCVVVMTWLNMLYSYMQELRMGSDRSHGYFRMSTKQSDYVLRLVGPHVSRLSTVYVAVYVHVVVRERRLRLR